METGLLGLIMVIMEVVLMRLVGLIISLLVSLQGFGDVGQFSTCIFEDIVVDAMFHSASGSFPSQTRPQTQTHLHFPRGFG
jgi:hypothetical protein